MSSYEFLAGCYDRFTYDVDYAAWADYIEQHFRKRGLPGKTVLDLACGTGSLTRELALRGLREMDVMLSAFYPEERRQIQESWQRLFRHHRAVLAGDLSGVGSLQAGLWRLKASWVTDMV